MVVSLGQTVLLIGVLGAYSSGSDVVEYSEATEGGTASLPCHLKPSIAGDKVSVVQWYRGDEEVPFYKYDLRGLRPQQSSELGDRYYFREQDDDKAVLTVSLIRLADEDVYHCLVDFARAPARKTHVNLTVIGERRFVIANL